MRLLYIFFIQHASLFLGKIHDYEVFGIGGIGEMGGTLRQAQDFVGEILRQTQDFVGGMGVLQCEVETFSKKNEKNQKTENFEYSGIDER